MLLTLSQAAKRAQVSEMTIRRRVRAGELQTVTEGVQTRYRSTDIDRAFSSTPPPPAPRGQARIIAIANQKGGVGKTTTAANLAAVLAVNHRVLAIDCDPQGNLSQALGADPEKIERTLYDVLINRAPISSVVMAPVLNLQQLSLVPSHIQLSIAERELSAALSRELKLKQAVSAVSSDYDYILLDCPPTLGLLTINALAAATEVIVPVDMAKFALNGVADLVETIEAVREDANPNLREVRALANRYDNTRIAQDVQAALDQMFGDRLFKTRIRQSVKLREAQAMSLPISVYSPKDNAAIDYRKLAEEVENAVAA